MNYAIKPTDDDVTPLATFSFFRSGVQCFVKHSYLQDCFKSLMTGSTFRVFREQMGSYLDQIAAVIEHAGRVERAQAQGALDGSTTAPRKTIDELMVMFQIERPEEGWGEDARALHDLYGKTYDVHSRPAGTALKTHTAQARELGRADGLASAAPKQTAQIAAALTVDLGGMSPEGRRLAELDMRLAYDDGYMRALLEKTGEYGN